MSKEKIRVPVKGGLDEARRMLKELRKKEPSPELIKIIEEVTNQETDKKPQADPNEIAAKPGKIPKQDLDL